MNKKKRNNKTISTTKITLDTFGSMTALASTFFCACDVGISPVVIQHLTRIVIKFTNCLNFSLYSQTCLFVLLHRGWTSWCVQSPISCRVFIFCPLDFDSSHYILYYLQPSYFCTYMMFLHTCIHIGWEFLDFTSLLRWSVFAKLIHFMIANDLNLLLLSFFSLHSCWIIHWILKCDSDDDLFKHFLNTAMIQFNSILMSLTGHSTSWWKFNVLYISCGTPNVLAFLINNQLIINNNILLPQGVTV